MDIPILAWAPAVMKNPTYMSIYTNLSCLPKNIQVIDLAHQAETQQV